MIFLFALGLTKVPFGDYFLVFLGFWKANVSYESNIGETKFGSFLGLEKYNKPAACKARRFFFHIWKFVKPKESDPLEATLCSCWRCLDPQLPMNLQKFYGQPTEIF